MKKTLYTTALLLAGYINYAQVAPATQKPKEQGDLILTSYIVPEPHNDTLPDENGIYNAVAVELSPEFPGGIAAFRKQVAGKIDTKKFEGAEGKNLKVYTKYIIEADGSMTGIQIIRDPGYGAGKQVELALKSIKTKWTAAKQNGKPVRCHYSLPIIIPVPGTKETKTEPVSNNQVVKTSLPDAEPQFPGGIAALQKYIINHIKFGNLAPGAETQYLKATMSFTVDREGNMINIKATSDTGYGFGDEIKRILSEITTKWSPCISKGRVVMKSFALPVTLNSDLKPAPANKTESALTNINLAQLPIEDQSIKHKPDAVESPSQDDAIYNPMTLQVKPEYPGGPTAFETYINDNVKKENLTADAKGQELKIHLTFVVEKNGSVTGVKTIKDPGFGLGTEIERIVKSLKTMWTPGSQNGRVVRSQYFQTLIIKVPQ